MEPTGLRYARGRRRSQVLLVHAFLVGISWFAIGLPFAILAGSSPMVSGSLRDIAASAPLPLTTGVAAVAAVFAFPYLWPVHMAVGAFEARLAFAMRDGSQQARIPAARVLMVQAIAYAVLAIALLSLFRGGAAWTVPAVIALAHALLARWIAARPREPTERINLASSWP